MYLIVSMHFELEKAQWLKYRIMIELFIVVCTSYSKTIAVIWNSVSIKYIQLVLPTLNSCRSTQLV